MFRFGIVPCGHIDFFVAEHQSDEAAWRRGEARGFIVVPVLPAVRTFCGFRIGKEVMTKEEYANFRGGNHITKADVIGDGDGYSPCPAGSIDLVQTTPAPVPVDV